MSKLNSKKISGGSSEGNIKFDYTKRCKDKKIRRFTISGYRDIFNNEYIFSLETKKLYNVYLFSAMIIIVDFILLLYFMKFMLVFYTVIIALRSILYVLVLGNKEIKGLHGAEHMVINSYLIYGKKVDLECIKKQSTISCKCGSLLFVAEFIAYIFVLITKLPIPLELISMLLFRIKFISKFFTPFERLTVEEPNNEQLLLAKYTFDLLIESMEKGLESEDKINAYIREYTSKCNEKMKMA